MSGSAAWTAALLPPSTLSVSSCARRCVQYRNSDGWGNNKPPCVFRKGAGVGVGGWGGSQGHIWHSSAPFQSGSRCILPLRSGCSARPIIVKGKVIITHLMRWKREQKEKKNRKLLFLPPSHWCSWGMICHPACSRLNIYKWTEWVNIEAKSFSQVCVSWAQSLQFNECLCAQS